jgi:hypothetical protein
VALRLSLASRKAAAVGGLVSLLACGYRPVYGTSAPVRLHVKVVRSAIADPVAADEVAAGMRDELAREGLLEAGEGYPRAEVEVLRADYASEGIAASGGAPLARATDFAVTARAWIVAASGAPPESDTGDVRGELVAALDVLGPGPGAPVDLRATVLHDADALRAAARRVGRTLARKLVGEPAATDDPVDTR